MKGDVTSVPREIRLRALDSGIEDVVAVIKTPDDDIPLDERGDTLAVLRDERSFARADLVACLELRDRQNGFSAIQVVVIARDRQDEIFPVARRPAVVVAESRGSDVARECAGLH